jgi:archaellum component FlaC
MENFRNELNAKFKAVDERFNEVLAKFNGIGKILIAVDENILRLERRLDRELDRPA